MAFRNKCEHLRKLNGDLVLIQECENKEKICEHVSDLNFDQFLWFGQNPNKGLGLISFNNYSLTLSPRY